MEMTQHKHYDKDLWDWTLVELVREYRRYRNGHKDAPSAWQADRILEQIAIYLADGKR